MLIPIKLDVAGLEGREQGVPTDVLAVLPMFEFPRVFALGAAGEQLVALLALVVVVHVQDVGAEAVRPLAFHRQPRGGAFLAPS